MNAPLAATHFLKLSDMSAMLLWCVHNQTESTKNTRLALCQHVPSRAFITGALLSSQLGHRTL